MAVDHIAEETIMGGRFISSSAFLDPRSDARLTDDDRRSTHWREISKVAPADAGTTLSCDEALLNAA